MGIQFGGINTQLTPTAIKRAIASGVIGAVISQIIGADLLKYTIGSTVAGFLIVPPTQLQQGWNPYERSTPISHEPDHGEHYTYPPGIPV